ncbi:MAG: hypothetical protein ACXVPN_10315 [Bacteroidia bacterium]
MRSIKVLNNLALLLTLVGCSDRAVSVNEYVNYVENESNGLHKSKIIDKYKIQVQYKPVEYIVAYEEKKEILDQRTVEARRKKLEKLSYFTLRLQSSSKDERILDETDNTTYNEKLNYFTFGMQEDLKLISGKDTLSCLLYNYVRNFDLAPYLDFVIAFDNKIKGNNVEFVYDGTNLGIGKCIFTFKEKDIINVPRLITN